MVFSIEQFKILHHTCVEHAAIMHWNMKSRIMQSTLAKHITVAQDLDQMVAWRIALYAIVHYYLIQITVSYNVLLN